MKKQLSIFFCLIVIIINIPTLAQSEIYFGSINLISPDTVEAEIKYNNISNNSVAGVQFDIQNVELYSFYDGGNHQEYIEFGAGPEFVFGEYKKKYFDYTRISLFPFYRLKSGDSVFKFDQISDQFTLNLSLDQQLYGPILLKTDATINLDSDSDDYGDFINSKISLSLQRRSYELGIFYQPHNQSGGIIFALHGFE